MPQESLMIAVALLAGLALAGSVWALMSPRFARPDPLKQRIERIPAAGTAAKGKKSGGERGASGKSVKDMVREIEEVQRRRGRKTLRLRLRQAGLAWSKSRYITLCAGVGLLVLLVGIVLGLGFIISAGFAVGAGIGVPDLLLRMLRRGRLKRMEEEFPNAIDVIVRGVKSGLPLPDCLRIIAAEAREPLRTEFGKIVRDQTVGLPVDEAIERFAQRVPLSEANFFAIVITIQSRTGGSLSESLSNLSTVLRERKKMRGKVRALSAEAKASAGIIGSLPVVVTIVIYLTSPDYMRLLFETLTGQLVIGGAVIWMIIGIVVMRQMINFEI